VDSKADTNVSEKQYIFKAEVSPEDGESIFSEALVSVISAPPTEPVPDYTAIRPTRKAAIGRVYTGREPRAWLNAYSSFTL
jgi:hypothetical protein